jgi:hypothetical protein
MKNINTQNYTTKTSQSEFTPEETRGTKFHNVWEGTKEVGRKTMPHVKSLGKSIWDIANYMGRGYAPFDMARDINKLKGRGLDDHRKNLDEFDKALKENVNIPREDIDLEVLRDILSEDLDLRSKALQALQKELDIDDKKLEKKIYDWLGERQKRGLTDEL